MADQNMRAPAEFDIVPEPRSAGHVPADDSCVSAGVYETDDRKATNDACAEILHALNNVLVVILLNAQIIEW